MELNNHPYVFTLANSVCLRSSEDEWKDVGAEGNVITLGHAGATFSITLILIKRRPPPRITVSKTTNGLKGECCPHAG